ncbi:hypothetical protein Patl1_32869 [Pistacia atlantica]|uniref:Uncharacterized protein n=1 Tax=Pistacia atlantica TaxID=434234 RepID=A0ACC1AM38_9ROSI|nr:hypothetical protein Patl1_32869 [Pistacia atlantica]
MMLVSLEGWWSEGERCWDEERSALLQLKPFFNSNNYLSNWVENSECCKWETVECDNITGKVIGINLFGASWDMEEWYLNASLFSPFQQLHWLDLSNNNIGGCIENEDYRGLKKLNILSLSGIETTDASVFLQSTLRSFSSLKTLDLSYNDFNGTIITRELHNLTTLEELNLNGSKLHIGFLQTVATCTSLKHLSMRDFEFNGFSHDHGSIYFRNLESLDMYGTALNNSFSQIFKPIISLKKLILSNCGLSGTLYDQG